MERVEFIGASYVGKSTLYNSLGHQMGSTDAFLTEQQFRSLARKRMNWFVFGFRKIMQAIIQGIGGEFRIYNFPKLDKLDNHTLDPYEHSLTICFQYEIISQKGIAFSNKIYLHLIGLIARYKFYQSLGTDKSIIVEESFIHWHLVMHELVKTNNLKLPFNASKDIGLFPKAIIYCHADESTIEERIKFRAKAKKINRNHLNMGGQDILRKVLRKQKLFQDYVSLAESFGVRVLQVNTAENIEDNTRKIQVFLDEISQ